MRIRLTFLLLLVGGILLAGLLRSTPGILAQPDSNYTLTLSTTTAGGTAVAGQYEMDLAIGQAEAGLQTGGTYELGGGFWGGGPVTTIFDFFEIYLPRILR